ncbi:MAG: tRNA pseudouridine(55) synthase TruB [Bacteroidales bacterium]|nr:tRNA pseudouridine(55) synthase TruB [Bacteroidales bacterium]
MTISENAASVPSVYEEGKLLLVDKPLRWTSFDVVNFLRIRLCKMLGIKKLKVGHAGTLDPLATGLLLICTGKFTKKIDLLQGMDKEYTGTMKLGATTPSYDAESDENHTFSIDAITEQQLYETARMLTGNIMQVPPIYSAIKIDGKKSYIQARKNHEVDLPARPLTIYEFELTKIDLPLIDFRVRCSKGTYIRSLAHDFGQLLNNGAYLTALRRTKIGDYTVTDAFSIEDWESAICK